MKQKGVTRSFVFNNAYVVRIVGLFMIILFFSTSAIGFGRMSHSYRSSQAREAARKKAEEEAARKKAEEEAARKKAEEEAARKKAEEEAARRRQEAEAEAEEEDIGEYEDDNDGPLADYDDTQNEKKKRSGKSSKFKSLLWSGK